MNLLSKIFGSSGWFAGTPLSQPLLLILEWLRYIPRTVAASIISGKPLLQIKYELSHKINLSIIKNLSAIIFHLFIRHSIINFHWQVTQKKLDFPALRPYEATFILRVVNRKQEERMGPQPSHEHFAPMWSKILNRKVSGLLNKSRHHHP